MRLYALLLCFMSHNVYAVIKTQSVEYSAQNVKMEGFVAFDDSKKEARPAVLIVHDWMGLGDFQKAKAQELANLGYVSFAADIYGKGIRPKDASEAAKFAGQYKGDRKMLRAHIRAAYDQLAAMKEVDAKHIVVMGYCFGGTTALELARSGAELVGTVSFHGGLSTPTPDDAKNIKGKVLALHGADDPFVKSDEVRAFKKEMKKAKIKLAFVSYPGAVHAFTIPTAGSDNSKGAAYNENADKKSWKKFQDFLTQVTQGK